jgi:hypothetical protein
LILAPWPGAVFDRRPELENKELSAKCKSIGFALTFRKPPAGWWHRTLCFSALEVSREIAIDCELPDLFLYSLRYIRDGSSSAGAP